MLPSWTRSSTPVTVTVRAVFQFAVVNVSDTGDTVPSVRSFDDNPTVTFAVGWVSRTTVNVAVPPASVVVSPEVGLTVIPTIVNVAVRLRSLVITNDSGLVAAVVITRDRSLTATFTM